jgi:hypothetical protein
LRESLQDYLAMRRALGFKLHTDGTGLLSFVAFMEQAQADYISTNLALAWAKQPTSVQPARWAQRLSYVRGFARYCRAIDPRTELPPLGLLPFPHQRPSPYFFTVTLRGPSSKKRFGYVLLTPSNNRSQFYVNASSTQSIGSAGSL